MLITAAVLGACGPVEEAPVEEDALGTEEQGALTGVLLGVVTGDIHTDVTQPLSTHSEQMVCEISGMGARWIRINADVTTTDETTYRRIVEKAHAKNIKVLVTVPAKYCGADNDQAAIDAFTTGYVNHLNELANGLFVGPVRADAYEIGNEPNVMENTGCSDSVSRPRVGANAFAWLLRRVWEWKQANARQELIVSGGLRNVYVTTSAATTTDGYWNSLFASSAFINGAGRIRPFDYLGVHPYNNNFMDYACINKGLTTCFVPWKNSVKAGLQAAAARMNSVTGTTDTKLFATEFGFQVTPAIPRIPPAPEPVPNFCAGLENCTLKYAPVGQGIPTPQPYTWYLQLAAGMNAAGEAFAASGVTPVALWNSYRDDAGASFGLRLGWDDETHKYPVKPAGWNKFRNLAGGTGSTNQEACWVAGTNFPVDFENGDTLRTTSSNDWAYGFYKGVCAPGERIMGLSKSIASGWARHGRCYKDPLDSGRYMHPTPETPTCTARDVTAGDARGTSQTTSEDWDSGNWRAECAPNEYVAGVAQSQDHKFSHVLCCPATLSAQKTCTTVPFGSADNQQDGGSGNWDAQGYKGECGVGRYVAGVSRTPTTGQPNALLCCTQ
ncbi:hypothetical protein [Hyalangium sp.]|uniref:hypothetical protein n=1 Tax=Hyalangium sp. TaxID=2028555 RepID=UPI002D3D4774|nr:hypothetical protein [Hyalangium sp.]HYH99581.1 hypothetical protein [Hyalangium sp.]